MRKLSFCINLKQASLAITCLSLTAIAAAGNKAQALAVAYPWSFNKGHEDAKVTAVTSVNEVLKRAGYDTVSEDDAKAAWKSMGKSDAEYGNMPSRATLRAFGKSVHATKVLYGSVSWHTRSIWVNLGPKTISTATVNAYVLDVASGSVTYRRKSIEGRSDEKSNGYKIAADVLFTPLVTAVSGGPATPQEQRAAQIAIATAFQPWIKASNAKM